MTQYLVAIHHPDDYLPDPLKQGQVLFVAASRARHVVSVQVPGSPHELYAPIASLL